MEKTQTDLLAQMDLQVDSGVQQQLYESAKWSRFISIVMFIAAGLILIAGVIGGAAFSGTVRRMGGSYRLLGEFGGPLLIVFIVLIAVVIGLVYYFLYNFSEKIKNALTTESRQDLNAGLRSLKTFFIISTVLAALSLLNSIVNLFN